MRGGGVPAPGNVHNRTNGAPVQKPIPARRILDDMDYWVAVLWTLLPTVVVSLVFFFVMRSVIRADRNERREYAKLEAEERARRGLPPVPTDAAPADR